MFAKNGNNVKTYFRVIYITICAMGLLYQSYHLLSEYLSGKTIVENRVERLKATKLPAITICLPFMVSFDRFSKTFPEYRDLYWEHKNLIAVSKNWTQNCADKLHAVFAKFRTAFFNQNLTLGQMFDNVSIDQLHFGDVSVRGLDEHGKFVSVGHIEASRSIVAEPYARICFTLFSQLNADYSLIETLSHFRQISFRIYHNNFDHFFHYFTRTKPYYLSLHSPNQLPDFRELDTFYPIELGYDNIVKYSETHTERLPAPFVTDCKVYTPGVDSSQDLRSDCVTKCISQRIRAECGIDCINSLNNSLLFRERNSSEYGNRICNSSQYSGDTKLCIELSMVMTEFHCQKQCPENCREVHYDFEVIKHTQYYRMSQPWDVLSLRFVHREGPDMVVAHKPSMKWIELISSFGGLSGMWLGISFVFIIDNIVKVVSKMHR